MATNWTLDGYRMKVNGQPFFAKGVSYSPVPWGSCPSFLPFGDFTIDTWKSIWTRDLPLMRNNSVNLLKTYNTLDAAQLKQGGFPITWDHSHKGFLDACWNGGDKPIYVLMGYAPPKNDMHIFYQEDWSKPANVAARAAMQTNLVTLATDYGGFDAVMGFVLANEINADNVRGNPAFWAYWNGVANAIATVAPGKLTLLANVDDSMQTVQFGANTMTAPNFFWGYNSYRGNWTNSNGFDNLFSTFATATQANPRPLMLTEWGSHNSTHDSNKNIIPCTPAQMANLITYVTGHHNNMLENRSDVGDPGGVCCGGTYFAWSNELWKADPPGFECNSKNAAPACHTQVWDPGPNMDFQDNIPGGYADEEAWGLFSIAPVDPKNRVPVVAGGCTGPWNPKTNSPYPPDTLTLLDHGRALFKAFDDNLYVVNYGPYALTKYVGPQDRNKNPPVKVTVGPASFTTVAPQQVTGGPPWQVTEHLTGPYLNDTNVTKLPAVIAFEPNYLTAVAY